MVNIFISFSGEAREEYALKFLNFFNKYGLKCWYDQHELLLGDNLKNKIIESGINNANYCILIINKAYLSRNWPCEEAILLFKKLESEKNHVIFPILLDITKEELKNSKLSFILEIKYQFLHTNESIEPIGVQILNRIFFDIAQKTGFKTLDNAQQKFKCLSFDNDINIYNALSIINEFDNTCYREKTIFLICLIKLFNHIPYEKVIREISYKIYNREYISFDIYKITESIFLIAAYTYF